MQAITISPFDNDRLKTRAVQDMLRDLGVLPDRNGERPSFVRNSSTAAELIDRALIGLAPLPALTSARNQITLANLANEKFAAAYEGGGGAEELVQIAVADFENDEYSIGGTPKAIADMFNVGDGWVLTAAVGLEDERVIVGSASHTDYCPAQPELYTALDTEGLGFTAVIDVELVRDSGYELYFNVMNSGVPNHHGLTMGVAMAEETPKVRTFSPDTAWVPVTTAPLYRIAMTRAGDTLAYSVNGSAGVAVDPTTATDHAAFNLHGYHWVTTGTLSGRITVKKATFYRPVSNAYLPTLTALP